MAYYQQIPEGKDPELWDLARRRASFRSHLATYIIMSLFFWVLWFLTGGPRHDRYLPWPVWPMFGWGIGLLFHYIGAYVSHKNDAVDREYQKLINQQSKL